MGNPIKQIINDELFSLLDDLNLLNRKMLRDLQMKRRYNDLRDSGLSATGAIDQILEEHSYLQYDTVRKIIYSVKLPEELIRRSA